MEKNLRIKVKNIFNEELEREWEYLSKISNISVFQTYNWNKNWVDHIYNKRDLLYILCVYLDNKIISIIPLLKKKILNISYLTTIGLPFSDYFDCLLDKKLIKNKMLSRQIRDYITNIKNIDLILINNIQKDSNFFFILNQTDLEPQNYKSYEIQNNKSQNPVNKKFEKDTLRQINRISSIGKIDFETYLNYSQKKKLINSFFKMKMSQLKKTKNWNYLSKTSNKSFLLSTFLYNVYSNVTCLKINGKIISIHLGYNFRNKLYYIFPVYDPKYSKFSPGNILLYYIIKNFFKSDGTSVDLTTGDEKYKLRISNKINMIYKLNFSFTRKGNFLIFLIWVKNKLKKNKYIVKVFNKLFY